MAFVKSQDLNLVATKLPGSWRICGARLRFSTTPCYPGRGLELQTSLIPPKKPPRHPMTLATDSHFGWAVFGCYFWSSQVQGFCGVFFLSSDHKFRKVLGCSHTMISVRWRALASRKSAPLLVLNLDFGPSGASNVRCQKSLMFKPSSHVLVVFEGGFVLFVWPLLQRDMVIDVFQAQVSCLAAIHPVAPSRICQGEQISTASRVQSPLAIWEAHAGLSWTRLYRSVERVEKPTRNGPSATFG